MQTILYAAWAAVYVICAALGLLTEGTGTVCGIFSLMFFLPPALLLIRGDRKDRRGILILSGASLLLTVVTILAGVFTENPDSQVLAFFTVLVSNPMAISPVWAQSLFLWACLLFGSIFGKRK